MSMFTPARAAVFVAALATAACGETSQQPEMLDPSLDVVAQTSADAALADLGFMGSDIGAVLTFTASDPGTSGLGLAGPQRPTRNATFYDSDGNVMQAYDSLLTASISWSSSHSREVSRGSMSGSMSHERDMRVTGLLGDETERTHNGSGSDARQRLRVDDENGDRSYSMESAVTIESVVKAVDREARPWPLSGSITRQVQVEIVNGPEGDVSKSFTAVLTFDGTQFPTMLVNGEAFQVDLAARAGKPAAERKQQRRGR